MSWLKGEAVTCATCGRTKKPIGRAGPIEMANGLFDDSCAGYREDPWPGDLWPGETRADFGYPKECPLCERPTRTCAWSRPDDECDLWPGALTPDGMRYCPKCGAALEESRADPT